MPADARCHRQLRGRTSVAVLLLLASASPGGARAATADGQACVSIAADGERLACYDRAHGRHSPPQSVAPPPASTPAPEPEPAEAASAPAAVAALPVPAAAPMTPAPVVAPPAPAPDDFGRTAIPVVPPPAVAREPDRIEARLAGAVDGLAQGQELVLDNGQRWVVIDDRALDVVADRPAVTLWRNLIGSYWLRFEPRGPQLRVRRVK